ncbi:hypothetical protein Dsin_030316 [Dipteronia sinensis]|uniref:Proteasome endopeptidase complex n=1 Tax=Dipteronia sinensis TaxID=43782 RepID=A0AAD9ZKC7_9ROSI|nr:hypothetical protein Dsin_030316 [Dipteronia sinensis]
MGTISVTYNGGVVLGTSSGMLLQTGGGQLIIVGGWDKYECGKIYGVGLGGLIEQVCAIRGSGSSYLYEFFDQVWKQRITKQEAEQLVIKALSLATTGVVRTVTINSEGVTTNFYRPGEEFEAHTSLLDLLNAPLLISHSTYEEINHF